MLALEEGSPAALEEGVFLSGTEQGPLGRRKDGGLSPAHRQGGTVRLLAGGSGPSRCGGPCSHRGGKGMALPSGWDCQTAADSDEPTPEQLARLGAAVYRAAAGAVGRRTGPAGPGSLPGTVDRRGVWTLQKTPARSCGQTLRFIVGKGTDFQR